MRPFLCAVAVLCLSVGVSAQVESIVIPAGTPEDKAIQVFSAEGDNAKKQAMIEDFLKEYAANPTAVAYGNWQLSQLYQANGDLAKALDFGDKALAAMPRNLDILVSQAQIAQQMKNGAKVFEYAVRGGEAYTSIATRSKPEGMTDESFKAHILEDQESSKNAYQFVETAAYNAIADEQQPKTRMAYIERFTPAFPGSQFEESVGQLAMYTLSQLNDMNRLVTYGKKSLAASPNSIPALLLMANAYAEDAKGANLADAETYAEKVVTLCKADAPDADRSKRLSAGLAQSAWGYALIRQDKTAAALEHFKAGAPLLKEDPGSHSAILYRLAFAYAKANRIAEAKEAVSECLAVPGPAQAQCRDLQAKLGATRKK
jgi:tetratricopeptide (TPR) repeat protein